MAKEKEGGLLSPQQSTADLAQRAASYYDLTVRQALFVVNYLITLDAAAAYTAAGFVGDPACARKLLLNPNVQRALRDQMRARMERTLVTADKVVASISHVAFDERVPAAHRLRALDMLCRHLGLYQDSKLFVDVNEHKTMEVTHRHQVDLSKLSTEEVEALYGLVQRALPVGGAGSDGRADDGQQKPDPHSSHH